MLTGIDWGSGKLPHFIRDWTASRTAVLWVALAVSLSGCESLVREIQAPEVEMVGLQFTGVQLNRQSFRVSLDVTNPNPIPVPISGFSYQIAVAGDVFADGSSDEAFTLPANGKERIRLNVGTDLLGTLNRVSSILKGSASTLDYEISGDLSVGLPLVKPIPFRRSGEIALKME